MVRNFLPLKLNFVIAQEANTPNTVFTTTAKTVASSVRRTALIVYLSVTASLYFSIPSLNASAKTMYKGRTRNKKTNIRQIAINVYLTNFDSFFFILSSSV